VILPIFGERIFPIALEGLDERRAGMLGMSLLMGSRGIGALLGPLLGGYWAGERQPRLRVGILLGFAAVALGYTALAYAPTVWLAGAAVVLAHAGGSLIWVFSTALLHFQAEDRFRGRVFSTDFGFLVLTMALVSYLAGAAVDLGVSVRTVTLVTGLLAVGPAAAWGLIAMPLWKREEVMSVPDDVDA